LAGLTTPAWKKELARLFLNVKNNHAQFQGMFDIVEGIAWIIRAGRQTQAGVAPPAAGRTPSGEFHLAEGSVVNVNNQAQKNLETPVREKPKTLKKRRRRGSGCLKARRNRGREQTLISKSTKRVRGKSPTTTSIVS